jgi:hypothetical protein
MERVLCIGHDQRAHNVTVHMQQHTHLMMVVVRSTRQVTGRRA